MLRARPRCDLVFGVWTGIAVASGLAGLLGVLFLQDATATTIAVITAVAACAILAMVADTTIPEAFERTHSYPGLIATVGFMVSFAVERLRDSPANLTIR
jgi:ZIP family zinc transporter